MQNIVGIRREDLSKRGERRVALTPALVGKLINQGVPFIIQSWIHPDKQVVKRAFDDELYQNEGAEITEDLSAANPVFGIKEIGLDYIMPDKAYYFFSHTHKGQIKNRKLLKTLVERRCSVIDYELIVNDGNLRTITAFTYFAGYAGMVDSLWTLGQRLKGKGISNPFENIPQAIAKGKKIDAFIKLIQEAGEEIRTNGTPAELPPLICCFLGSGKTSTGAQRMYDYLPHQEISLEELPEIYQSGSRKQVYKLVLEIPDMYRLKEDSKHTNQSLSRQQIIDLYLKEPRHFESNMDRIFPYCMIWMNCIIWSRKFPRLITREQAEVWYSRSQTLRVIGDITCDPEGAIQFSKETWIDDPVFIYHPLTQETHKGFEGEGIAVMAVTNLPCEFSADASTEFSQNLEPYIEQIVKADYQAHSPEEAGLPEDILRAVILWKGKFTPRYEYMSAFLKQPQ